VSPTTIVAVDAFRAEGVGGQRTGAETALAQQHVGDPASSGQAEIVISEIQLVGS
jgi:hypothetical protein